MPSVCGKCGKKCTYPCAEDPFFYDVYNPETNQFESRCMECAMASALAGVGESGIRLGKPIFEISEEEVDELAKKNNIPTDKINYHVVQKYIEAFNFEGAYTIWDAILDGLKEGAKWTVVST